MIKRFSIRAIALFSMLCLGVNSSANDDYAKVLQEKEKDAASSCDHLCSLVADEISNCTFASEDRIKEVALQSAGACLETREFKKQFQVHGSSSEKFRDACRSIKPLLEIHKTNLVFFNMLKEIAGRKTKKDNKSIPYVHAKLQALIKTHHAQVVKNFAPLRAPSWEMFKETFTENAFIEKCREPYGYAQSAAKDADKAPSRNYWHDLKLPETASSMKSLEISFDPARDYDGNTQATQEPTPAPQPETGAQKDFTGILSDVADKRARVMVPFDNKLMKPEAVSAILKALPAETEVILLVTPGLEPLARQIATTAGREKVRFSEVPDLKVWVRDPLMMVKDADGTICVYRPKSLSTQHDWAKKEPFEKAVRECDPQRYRFAQAELNFEGGQIVTDGQTALVSEALLVSNSSLFDVDRYNINALEEKIRPAFQKLTHAKKVIRIRPLRDWEHIDLYVTLLDAQTVLVADTRLGTQLLSSWIGTTTPEKNPNYQKLKSLCQESALHKHRGKPAIEINFNYRGQHGFTDLERHAEDLDAIARQLRYEGFKVLRIPSLLGRSPYAFTYNNVFRSGKDVLIPQFGLDAVDQAAAEVFQKQGLKTHPVPAESLACYAGVLHCSLHELARPENVKTLSDGVHGPY